LTINKILFQGPKYSRVLEVTLNSKTLVTPTYFPSISSYGSKYPFFYLLQILSSYSYPRILISAYDIHNLSITDDQITSKILKNYISKSFVFLDSGIYESQGFKDSTWTFDSYLRIIKLKKYDFFSSFDSYPSIKMNSGGLTDSTLKNIQQTLNITDNPGLVSIIHGLHPKLLFSILKKVLDKQSESFHTIAVSEDDCGATLFERIQTITRLRKLLNSYDSEISLHILGCGTPLSLAFFALNGADSFDSLDWTRFAVNSNNYCFEDPSYLDLFECTCSFCNDEELPYIERLLLHNLLFYQEYMEEIRRQIRLNSLDEFIKERFNKLYKNLPLLLDSTYL